MAEPERTDQEWALQRRLEDVFSKLGEKFGDLTGRVETKMRSTVTFGGAASGRSGARSAGRGTPSAARTSSAITLRRTLVFMLAPLGETVAPV